MIHRRPAPLAILLLAACLLPGCTTVLTTVPPYTDKDLVREPALAGAWRTVEGGRVRQDTGPAKFDARVGAGKTLLELRPAKDGAYTVLSTAPPAATPATAPATSPTTKPNTPAPSLLYLCRLGPHYLAVAQEADGKPMILEKLPPGTGTQRMFFKVALIGDRLLVYPPDGVWFAQRFGIRNGAVPEDPTHPNPPRSLEAGDKPLGHLIVATDKDFHTLLLTDTTERQRAFFLRHAASIFRVPILVLQRLPGTAQTQPGAKHDPKPNAMASKEQQSFEVLWLTAGLIASFRSGEADVLPELPLDGCDPPVAALYRDLRAALAACKPESGRPALSSEPEDPPDPADHLAAIAGRLPADHPQRKPLLRLARDLARLTDAYAKKYPVTFTPDSDTPIAPPVKK